MNIRHTRMTLWLLAFSCGMAAITVAIMAWSQALEPVVRSATNVKTLQPRQDGSTTNVDVAPSLDTLKLIWNLNLRRPLFDPPKLVVAPAPPPPPPPPLAVRLVGTIVEPAIIKTPGPPQPTVAQAMLITARGQLEIKQVGDTVGESSVSEGARILAIQPSLVTVLYLGKELQIHLEEQAAP